VQRHNALRHGQLLLPPVSVLVNGTGLCVERRVEERAALAWRALAAHAPAGCPGRWCRGSMRTGGPEEGVHKGVNTGVNGVNRGVNRGVHMVRERGARAGAVQKAHLTATTVHDSKDGHPHPHWGLHAVCVRLQLEVESHGGSKSCSVQRWHVRGGRHRRSLPRPTRRRAVRPEVGPLG